MASLKSGLDAYYAALAQVSRNAKRQTRKAQGGHAKWPMKNTLALSVHPKQVEAAQERARRHGICVEYNPNGTVNIPDVGNYRKLCRLEGVRNKCDYN
jgi:hypothetical protein